jgi:hypothetical protein
MRTPVAIPARVRALAVPLLYVWRVISKPSS